jgi:hypothetical protein
MPKPGPSGPIATVAAALELACGGPPPRFGTLIASVCGIPASLTTWPDREIGTSG